jgi:hypothetical protein
MSRAAALVAKVTKRPRVTEAQLESAARVVLEQRVRITIAAADKTWTIEPAPETAGKPVINLARADEIVL